MSGSTPLREAFASHPRHFETFRWAYPVLSRRSGGISLGVNLNPDRVCNFDCPYCQVDRRGEAPSSEVDPDGVALEVRELLARIAHTGLAEVFPDVAPRLRPLVDVALSGDGEPTLRREFPQVCRNLSDLRREWIDNGGGAFKLVLITNATLLDRPAVEQGLKALCREDGGEIWGKLDAGTEAFYQRVNVSRTPLSKVVSNLGATAAWFPLRVQTLFFEQDGVPPDAAEIEAWLDRLDEICQVGRPLGVQLHTVARRTSQPGCRPMPLEWLMEVAERVRSRTGLAVDCRGGIASGAIGGD
jgi:wyosine [tRNA(Phe)-imidazoG37] synthetase (radical SAM superfamily)